MPALQFLNWALPPNNVIRTLIDFFVSFLEMSKKQSSISRSQRLRKEDMIRVVHVSDVHFDEKYDPVRKHLSFC